MSSSPLRTWSLFIDVLINELSIFYSLMIPRDSSYNAVNIGIYEAYRSSREDPFEISIQEIKLIHVQRHKAIELMASFNDCFHLASLRARSSDDAPKSFRVFPTCPFSGNDSDDFIAVSFVSPSCFLSMRALLDADRSANTEVNFVTEINDSTPNVRRPCKLRPRPYPVTRPCV